jgi:hypothetical protein
VIVFDDYAENIQQNQVKTAILATVSRFFSKKTVDCPRFTGKNGGKTSMDRWPASDS